MAELIRYDNGLRLILERLPSVRSAVTGIWVGAGSCDESDGDNGISHFTEHMMFKGTDKLSAFEIAESFERLGANINAFTGKECTCYYVKSIDEHAEKCFGLLAHIFFDSTFPDAEIVRERKVVEEEINMVEDAPEEICYDLLAKSLYGAHPLGKTILGPKENVRRFTGMDAASYTAKKYRPDNMVVAVAGNVTAAQADGFVKKYILTREAADCAPAAKRKKIKNVFKRTHTERISDNFEQANIGIGFPSLGFNDPQSTVQGVLSTVLGGSMSSRLFQRVREELGLCYSIYTAPSAYTANGSFNILVNISARNTAQTLDAIFCELKRFLKEGVTPDELARAKNQLKSACIFAQESVQTVMSSSGKLLTLADEPYEIDKKLREIDAVTADAITALANGLFTKKEIASAYVGKAHGVNVEKFAL
ncbi:MAG: insulinase family protein [Clostridiales bacterium]|jgi:predicted Zn-dependent peptidase|nr:insulinase family protein [Clostridiales bacterium]